MANLLFKINIETESGREISYCNTALAATTDTNISASFILGRINTMISCSYASDANAPASEYGPADEFQDASNIWLEASADGHQYTGSIEFTHTDDQDGADRMKRYRFFGTKVCNVLGLPEGQWIYPENFHLDDSGGTNYFSGDVAAANLSLTRGFTMANTATVRSNLRYSIDKTADLFTQFTTGSGAFQSNALLLGYNSDTDKYVLDKGDEDNLHINATVVSASIAHISNDIYLQDKLYHHNGTELDADSYIAFGGTNSNRIEIHAGGDNLFEYVSSVGILKFNNDTDNVDFQIRGEDDIDELFYADVSTERIGIGTDSPSSLLTVAGDIACSGEIVGGTRAYFDGGEASAFSSDRYLDFNNGTQMDDYEGYRMHRAGSITGVSCQFNCTANAGGSVDIEVRKNGVKVFEKASVSIPDADAATRYGDSATQARGTDTFVVGDVLTLYVCVNGSVTLDDFNAFFEVTFDT